MVEVEVAIVDISAGGRVTIPKEARGQLGWEVGDKVLVFLDLEHQEVLLRKVKSYGGRGR